MLRLVVRRAWVQRRLLCAVVLLVASATALMGFYSLLLGVTGPRAFSEQVQRTQPQDVDVTAYVVGVAPSDLNAARRGARGVVQQVLAPLHPSLVTTTTSQMRRIGGSDRLGYLATSEPLAGQVALTSGRWPDGGVHGPVEALASDATARTMRLGLGDRVRLGPGPGLGASTSRATVVVVGTFRALPRAAAESDPLSGAGFEPAYNTGGVAAPAYGPFLVRPAAFRATGLDVDRMRVDGHPDLSTADDASLSAAVASLGSASGLLSSRLAGSADITRVGSDLPGTLDRLHTQAATTRSAVLVALLLDTMVVLAALVLAGRLVADSRADERDLLTSFGLGPVQQLALALLEASLLAVTSALLAVPAAVLAFSWVTHLPDLAAARLSQDPTVTPALVATVVGGAALLTLVLVVAPLVSWDSGRLSARQRVVARSGADALLLLIAVAGWWQLHARSAAATNGDTVLVVAPVLCLAAATIVAVRGLPPLFALAAAQGSRSRSLLPLSLHPGSLRLGAATALVLLSMASAAATFGVAVHSTWQRSQHDQAALQVGTDASLALDAPPTAHDAAAVARTAAGSGPGVARSVVSPVTTRPVALGHYFGDPGSPPVLVALDMEHAGSLLRGRPAPGTSWSDVGRRLVPSAPVRGLPIPAGGAGVTAVGRAPAGVSVSVTPTLVVQDPTGFRSTLDAAAFPADGRSHRLLWSGRPAPGQRIVAVDLSFAREPGGGHARGPKAAVSVALRVPGGQGALSSGWQATQLSPMGVVLAQSASVRRDAQATVLTTHAVLHLPYLLYEDGEVLATAFAPPAAVPVAESQALADATGTPVGGTLSATLGDTVIPLRVVEIVPTVPSTPGRIAVLADVDTVSRALISTGHLEPAIDAFWVSSPSAGSASALSGLKLGEVTTRDHVVSELTRGPMQITLPVAYVTVAGSAALLLLAGAVLVVSADQRRRTAEVGRLRALGLTRAGARRLVLAQHAALLVALVLAGVLVGAAAAAALDRSLVRSEQGTAPVPPAVLDWPWGAEALLAGCLVVACLAIAAVAAALQVRRSDTAQRRAGEW